MGKLTSLSGSCGVGGGVSRGGRNLGGHFFGCNDRCPSSEKGTQKSKGAGASQSSLYVYDSLQKAGVGMKRKKGGDRKLGRLIIHGQDDSRLCLNGRGGRKVGQGVRVRREGKRT